MDVISLLYGVTWDVLCFTATCNMTKEMLWKKILFIAFFQNLVLVCSMLSFCKFSLSHSVYLCWVCWLQLQLELKTNVFPPFHSILSVWFVCTTVLKSPLIFMIHIAFMLYHYKSFLSRTFCPTFGVKCRPRCLIFNVKHFFWDKICQKFRLYFWLSYFP